MYSNYNTNERACIEPMGGKNDPSTLRRVRWMFLSQRLFEGYLRTCDQQLSGSQFEASGVGVGPTTVNTLPEEISGAPVCNTDSVHM